MITRIITGCTLAWLACFVLAGVALWLAGRNGSTERTHGPEIPDRITVTMTQAELFVREPYANLVREISEPVATVDEVTQAIEQIITDATCPDCGGVAYEDEVHGIGFCVGVRVQVRPAEVWLPCSCGGSLRPGVAHWCRPPHTPIDRSAR